MNLTERAREIIAKEIYSREDIKELQSIKFEMNLLYGEKHLLAKQMEADYNRERPKKYVELKELAKETGVKMTEKEAETRAKLYAEEAFGEYRVHDAEAKMMRSTMEAIKGVTMTYHANNKQDLDTSYTANME